MDGTGLTTDLLETDSPGYIEISLAYACAVKPHPKQQGGEQGTNAIWHVLQFAMESYFVITEKIAFLSGLQHV